MDENRKKTGGRQKGTPNKRTQMMLPLIEQLANKNFDVVTKIVDLYPSLEPEGQSNLLVKLLEFIFPKKRQISVEEAQETLRRDLASKGLDINSITENV